MLLQRAGFAVGSGRASLQPCVQDMHGLGSICLGTVITSLLGHPGKAGHSCVYSRPNLRLESINIGKRGLFGAGNVGHAEDQRPTFPRFENAE